MIPPPLQLTVDPDHARWLLLDELSRPEYSRSRSLLRELWEMIVSWFNAISDGSGIGRSLGIALLIFVIGALAVSALMVIRTTGLLHRNHATHSATAASIASVRSADELLQAARSAQAEGHNREAVLLGVRALVKDLDERTILDVTDGMTALEAARKAAPAFPDLRSRLVRAAHDFDRAAYSRWGVSSRAADDVILLADYVRQTSPQWNGVAA
ncbi:DUF4129 domain-containing protein [Devriesea agamarum]|uniref:DUF4129 domain-containing protein n=1 Tax=Devriesea agamarum TaxID=472569 RepID=UPI00071D77B5|nr:DUF4129 domain-containing protein [Devriesea agamarum]